MDDLISRQNLIMTLTVTAEETKQMKVGDLKKLINVINNQPSAQQWTPCSERLPKKKGRYLVTSAYGPEAFSYWFDCTDDAKEYWRKRIKAWMPSAQRWIPCSKRLPEEPGRYVVTDKYGDVRFAMYSTKIPMWWGGANQPTAWMPLPEAYKEEDDG